MKTFSIFLVALQLLIANSTRAQNVSFSDALTNHVQRLPAEQVLRGKGIGEAVTKIIANDFQVLGIGEQSHGTSEFFKVRMSLIHSLSEDQSINKIGLEAPMAEVEKLNDYLFKNEGDLKAILKSFRLYNYECTEFVEMVEAVKRLNQPANQKIRFFGFDMQSPFQSVQNISDICFSGKSVVSDSLKQLANYYNLLNNEVYNHSFSEQDFDDLNRISKMVFDQIEKTNSGCQNNSLFIKSVTNYKQFLMLNDPVLSRDMASLSKVRDSLMALNVLNEIQPGHRIIILAHNGHVQKTPNVFSNSMGYYLYKKLGKEYKVIGQTTSSGFYTAFNGETGKVIDQNPIVVGDNDTFERYFSQIDTPVFLIRSDHLLKDLKGGPRPGTYRMLVFGATDKQFFKGNLLEDYDYVIHIQQTMGNASFYLN
jgi:erythromycin esterase-like protein